MLFKRVQKGSAYCAFPRESLNKVFTILENIEGDGCEIQKSFMGKHWKIIVTATASGGIDANLTVLTGATLSSDGIQFTTMNLTFTKGLLTEATSGSPVIFPVSDCETLGNSDDTENQ